MALTLDGLPIGNGILTVENEAQALTRARPDEKDKGGEAAKAAIAMLELKQRYRTSSHEVLALRFIDLPEPCIVTVVDNDHVSRRKSNAWPTRRRLEPAELKCQRQVHQSGEPARVAENGWTVQGWPVHQADWKREVLRSQVEEM